MINQEENNVNPETEEKKMSISWTKVPLIIWLAIGTILLFAIAWLSATFKRVNVCKPTFLMLLI